MKNMMNKIAASLLVVFAVGQAVHAQGPGVGPAPYCMPAYGAIPCNQPGPSNSGSNYINDFINSVNTTGGAVNITNNNSGCNTQVIAGQQVNYTFFTHSLVACPGTPITINVQSGIIFGQGFSVFIDWNNNNVFNLPGERVASTPGVPGAGVFTALTFVIPVGQAPGTYRMRVRCMYATNGGVIDPCNYNYYGEAEDYRVVVNIPPGQTTVTANSPLCSGQTLSLTSAIGGLIPGFTPTFTWTGPNSFTSSVQNPTLANVQPVASGIYSVNISTGSCPVQGTVQVYVNPTPTVTAANNGPLCQGSNLNLTTPAVPGGTLVNYNWSGPGGYVSNVQNPVIANAQPTNSGVYTITAVNNFSNGGVCQSSNTTSVGVVPVNQTTVTPTFTLCQGANLNLTAANGVPPNSYLWSGPNSFTSSFQNPSVNNTMPVHAGNYVVTASYATPGITLVCTSTAVSNVSIVATSPVTVSVPNNICQYATANLIASTNPAALAYQWNGPGGFTATGNNTTIANIQPNSTGAYVVTATWAIGSVSCNINGFNQINVVPVGDIAINPPTAVCYPSNVQLTSSSPGAISYNWTATTGFTSNVANPLLTAPGTTASGLYTVTTAYTNGALICYNSSTTQVTVNPIISFSLEPYRQVCYNSTYTLNGPNGATSYTWEGAGGFTSNNQILSIPSIQPGMAGGYTLSVNLGPCKTTASTQIEVLSPIAFTLTPGNKVICKGDEVKLQVAAAGGSHNNAFTWNPAVYLSSPTGSAQTAKPEGTTIYNVTGYDIACPNYTVSTSFTLTVNKAPEPDLQLAKVDGCEPLCLTYNSRTQKDATSIVYDFGDGRIVMADSFSYCLPDPGSYKLKIQTRGKNGCRGVYEHPELINVWPKPHTSLAWTPEVPSTTQNHVTFEPSHLYSPVVKYQWEFLGTSKSNGYDTASVKYPVRVYENTGKFPVLVISQTDKGCIDSVFKIIEIIDEFNIFIPNTFTPNGDGLNDVFNVKGLGLKAEGYSMEIYDRWGSLVYSTKDALKGWDGTVKGLMAENGVYVYKVKALGANGEGRKEYVGHVTLLK
jgi:gliding motility-associated-like protein